jgi:Fe-S oxidoreductase
MDLRDHLFAKAPYLLAADGASAQDPGVTGIDEAGESSTVAGAPNGHHGVPESGFARVATPGAAQAERPLVGTATEGGVIDPDVLWSCTTCGACVEQCPVDIEHVDHIVDMRRYQVLIESAFPSELSGLFKNLENKGNPWGMNASARLDWTRDLPFAVPVVGQDIEDLRGTEYLFWVGCAGAYEDRAKKTTQAVAELLHMAGVSFAVLGEGETCTGDPARRAGNEFLYQMLAQQNVEMLREAAVAKVVVTCPHCFNTIGREYRQLGLEVDVVHHTQLLNRLVRDGRLTPVTAVEEKITYHDPCYLGRHNKVYAPPRDLLGALPGLELTEMPRNSERSFCCGAGGARMWMEEKIGKRINDERTEEALATGASTIAAACPFCRIMINDSVTSKQADGAASEDVQVMDVATMLLRAVKTPASPEPAAPVT